MGNYANDFELSNRLYYKDLKDFKGLTKKDEYSLIESYRNNNDIIARNKLVTSNLKFVVDIAKKYKGRGLPFGDLVSEGNMGLMHAIEKFDEKRNNKIISYSVWWIRQYIKDAISKNNLLPPSDLPTDNSSDAIMEDDLACDENNTYNSLPFIDNNNHIENNEHIEIINNLLTCLNKREQEIIISYFGLKNSKELTLEEIGKKYNLTKERVRQIKEVAMKKMRSNMLLMEDKSYKY